MMKLSGILDPAWHAASRVEIKKTKVEPCPVRSTQVLRLGVSFWGGTCVVFAVVIVVKGQSVWYRVFVLVCALASRLCFGRTVVRAFELGESEREGEGERKATGNPGTYLEEDL